MGLIFNALVDQLERRRTNRPDGTTQMPQDHAIQPDWRAYWKAFSASHGGFPVRYKNVLLFRDGWTYSATDYAGPEMPPPTDPIACAKLIRMYWFLHKTEITKLLTRERAQFQWLSSLRETRSMPLIARVPIRDDRGRIVAQGSEQIDLDALRESVRELEAWADECDSQIQQLS